MRTMVVVVIVGCELCELSVVSAAEVPRTLRCLNALGFGLRKTPLILRLKGSGRRPPMSHRSLGRFRDCHSIKIGVVPVYFICSCQR